MSKSKITYTPRVIIEAKLLAAFDDEDKVAVVCSKQDLDDLLELCTQQLDGWSERQRELVADLQKLRAAAFGEAL